MESPVKLKLVPPSSHGRKIRDQMEKALACAAERNSMLSLLSRRLFAWEVMRRKGQRFKGATVLMLVFLCNATAPCSSQDQHFLCNNGFGYFSSEFQTGITATVSASKNRGFANRACDATLQWGKAVLPVIRGAWKVDIDVMGADLGLGAPVVAFQTKRTDSDKLATYEIYSLSKPPRLLRTITGGDYYDAQDFSLDNRVSIWTHDAGAVDGFEDLPLYSFDFLPTFVLRFEKGKLIDVSSEYQPYYDRQIARVQALLTPQALNEFRNSDGKLSSTAINLEDLHTLLRTKIKVLEIVWSYLYSGREQEAWNALASMWPPADLRRIRAAIEEAQARGLLRQVDQIEEPRPKTRRKHHAMVYDMSSEERQVVNMSIMPGEFPSEVPNPETQDQKAFQIKTRPIPIYLSSPPPENKALALPASRIYFTLVIDAAGKVRSARLVDKADSGPVADTEIRASEGWKFIPGFRAGRAVACKIEFGVAAYQ